MEQLSLDRLAVEFLATIVGECNPYGGDPEFALYPSPRGCAGQRMCDLVLGVDPELYLDRYERVNLCAGRWAGVNAKKRAGELAGRGRLVLLGAKVCWAFGEEFFPFTSRLTPSGVRIRLPHPSGRSRLWNAPGAYARARELLASCGCLP